MSERDRDEARRCFETAIATDPQDSFAHHKLGLLLLEEFDDVKGARKCFETAIRTNPRNAAAYNSLACLQRVQHPDRALANFEKSIELDPQCARPHKNLGLLYVNQFHDYAKAKDCFIAALRVDPHNASVYVALGQAYECLKDIPQAERCYQAAIQADSSNPSGYVRLGTIKMSAHNNEAAKALFEEALRADPNDSSTSFKLGRLAEQQGRFDEAKTLYVKALKLNASLPKASKTLERLMRQHFPDEPAPDLTVSDPPPSFDLSMSAGSMYEDVTDVLCPRGHPLVRIKSKPRSYKPAATWACEECRKSIGGPELVLNGALHCYNCKYSLCSTCESQPRQAHVLPEQPQLLGSGGFGDVFKEYDPRLGTYVAVKHIRLCSPSALADVKGEVELMRRFAHHPHIVHVFRLENTSSEARVYMELMNGSVQHRMQREGPLHEIDVRRVIRDALRGLAALHGAEHPVLHRDIKPDNLLIAPSGAVKLSDFGLSKNMPQQSEMQTMKLKGTPLFLAPECFADPPRWSSGSDIWALACSWVTLSTGKQPWHGVFDDNTILHSLAWRLQNEPELHPQIPSHLSHRCQVILQACFNPDRHSRPTASALLADTYFSESCPPSAEELETADDFHRRCSEEFSSNGVTQQSLRNCIAASTMTATTVTASAGSIMQPRTTRGGSEWVEVSASPVDSPVPCTAQKGSHENLPEHADAVGIEVQSCPTPRSKSAEEQCGLSGRRVCWFLTLLVITMILVLSPLGF